MHVRRTNIMKILKISLTLLLFIFVGSNALAQSSKDNASPKKTISKAEKDSIQIRRFEGAQQDLLRATAVALNSLGFEDIKTDSFVGQITASQPDEDLSESTAARTVGALASAFTLGIVGNDDKTTTKSISVSILVSKLTAASCNVKIVLKQTITTETANWVSSTKKDISDLTDSPKEYEDIFKEITNQFSLLVR